MGLSDRYIMGTYNRAPLVIRSGEGSCVYDPEGKAYLDFISGIAVNGLGHCYPGVTEAIRSQAGLLLHASNLYYSEPQIQLAKKLISLTFEGKVFFCNSGAEANEAALKLVRKYFKTTKHPDRYEVISMKGSFHGRTFGALSASGQEKLHKGFEPLLPGFVYVDFNDLGAVEKAIGERTGAILVEPVQGEKGVLVPSAGYLKGLRELADRHGLLLVLDEIQTGLGRTGTLFAYQKSGIIPDILTLAKGLGGGVPIGAMIASNRVNAAFVQGSHGSTFGGNPLACAAGFAVVEALTRDEEILENCRKMGDLALQGLAKMKTDFPQILEVRGQGLLIGMELQCEGRPIVLECMEAGLLINVTSEKVLRFAPPLNITAKEVESFLRILRSVFEKTFGK